MRAITLWQPWASLVVTGEKRYETRSWATSYRGPLAIHAAAKFPPFARAIVETDAFWPALRRHRFHQHNLQRGAVVGVVRLVAVREVVELSHNRRALGGDPLALRLEHREADLRPVSGQELAFGDWTPGRFAWVLDEAVELGMPIAAVGRQGLWDWTPPGADPVIVFLDGHAVFRGQSIAVRRLGGVR